MLLHPELKLNPTEVDLGTILEWNFRIWCDPIPIHARVIRAIEIGYAPLPTLLAQKGVPAAHAACFATVLCEVDIRVNTADRIFAPDDELTLRWQTKDCAIAAHQSWATLDRLCRRGGWW